MKNVAAVLFLGNTKFDAPPNNSEGSTVMSECEAAFAQASGLIGAGRQELELAICSQTRTVAGQKIRSPLNVGQASDFRDSLAKALYGVGIYVRG